MPFSPLQHFFLLSRHIFVKNRQQISKLQHLSISQNSIVQFLNFVFKTRNTTFCLTEYVMKEKDWWPCHVSRTMKLIRMSIKKFCLLYPYLPTFNPPTQNVVWHFWKRSENHDFPHYAAMKEKKYAKIFFPIYLPNQKNTR